MQMGKNKPPKHTKEVEVMLYRVCPGEEGLELFERRCRSQNKENGAFLLDKPFPRQSGNRVPAGEAQLSAKGAIEAHITELQAERDRAEHRFYRQMQKIVECHRIAEELDVKLSPKAMVVKRRSASEQPAATTDGETGGS